jgi:prevent-host-death family protein
METRVGIAELKSRLSHYLRAARRGRSVAVFDRDTPVARLVPYAALGLLIREHARGAPRLGDVPLLPTLRMSEDVVGVLLEERRER